MHYFRPKFILSILGLFLLCLSSPSIAQESSQTPTLQNITPALPAPEIPPPPAVSLPDDPIFDNPPKTPLSWRSKALALGSEYPFKEKGSLIWTCPLAYDKAIICFKRAVYQAGLYLLAEYADAGQFLLSETNVEVNMLNTAYKKNEIIVVSHPISESQTMFKLRIYSGNNLNLTTKVNTIPQMMKDLMDKGLWQ